MAEGWVDFKAIKTAASLEQILRRYGVVLRPSGVNHLRGRCPLPTHTSEKTTQSFILNTEKNVWACQSSSCVNARGGTTGGNVLDFVVAMERCSIYRAAVLLKKWLGSTESQTKRFAGSNASAMASRPPRTVVENRLLPFTLSGIESEHPYLVERGISREVARHFGAGFYSGGGRMTGRVVIPIHNQRGALVAYVGRSIDDAVPKYRFPAGFRKSQEVYNLHRVEAGTHRSSVVVVEGFFDCWKVHQAGFSSVVALMGCALSDVQAELLERRFDAVVLFLDGDPAGRAATAIVGNRLASKLRVQVAHVPDNRQPDQLSRSEICRCLAPMAVS